LSTAPPAAERLAAWHTRDANERATIGDELVRAITAWLVSDEDG
jgi:hypothetical protein